MRSMKPANAADELGGYLDSYDTTDADEGSSSSGLEEIKGYPLCFA